MQRTDKVARTTGPGPDSIDRRRGTKRWQITAIVAGGLAVACGQHTPTGPSASTVARVEIVPAGPLTVPQSDTLPLQAEALDAAGAVLTGIPATWGSTDPAVAQVSSTGIMSSGSVGTATIWSFIGGKGDSLVVSVTADARASGAVLVGAGDIVGCYDTGAPYLSSMETAALLDATPGTVFTLGDNAYRPAPGNHEYNISSNAYFDYFNGVGTDSGPAGKRGQGYYSYDTGGWHIVVLNSEVAKVGVFNELAWLKADLAAHPTACSLAYWHRPFFSSGPHPPYLALTPLIQALYTAGVDVVVSGHNHQYERFAPQDINRQPDPNGIRAFVAGTGGATEYGFKTAIQPNSEVRGNGPGVLKFTLLPTSYRWQFIPVPGVTFTDSGTGQCH
jgi:hypothetical protein